MKRCTECGLFAPDDAAACARCEGTAFTAEGTPLLVDGRYSLEEQLGHGGMGIVYRARDVWLDRPVAIKLISPKLLQAGDLTAQFRREAATLASVRSEHVVQVYSFGPHEGSFFFAMEYVRGNDLDEIMVEHASHGESLPLARMLTIMQQAAKGLGAVHRAGLIHLDVKPSNIVIEEDTGRPVLVDFGLARWRGQGAQTVKISGTPYYMAPERCGTQVEASALTPQTDIYSLGCMLFEVLTGKTPFDGSSPYAVLAQHMDAPIPKVSAHAPDLVDFDAVVARAMAKRPGDRYESCDAFAAAIAAVGPKRTLPPAEDTLPSAEPTTVPVPLENRVFRVMVVDDDPAFRKLASKAAELALRDVKVEITAVGSGDEALAAAREHPHDLLTLDFDMPGLDGTETLSELRALPHGTHTRVAVVSGSAGPAERWRFAVLGVNEFIAKPVELRDLTEALRRIARRSGWIDVKPLPKSSGVEEGKGVSPTGDTIPAATVMPASDPVEPAGVPKRPLRAGWIVGAFVVLLVAMMSLLVASSSGPSGTPTGAGTPAPRSSP